MIYVGGHTRTLNNVWRTADIIASVTVGVYDSTIRKWLSKTSIRKRVPMQKPVLTKKITKAHLTSSLNNKPQDFGENSLFTTKSGSFWPITSTINMPLCLQEHHQGSGSVMGWGCFTASQPGQLGVIDGTPFLLSVWKDYSSVCDLKLTWVPQQGTDPEHISEFTRERKMKELKWPSYSLDVIEILWHDFKQAIRAYQSKSWLNRNNFR